MYEETRIGISNARNFVFEGLEQILNGRLDEAHGVSVSPGATALASMALLALGHRFENAHRRGLEWLVRERTSSGWGKFPGDQPDQEITQLVSTLLQGSQSGILAKIILLAQAKQFSNMILSIGQTSVPGLEGPRPDEIVLPTILEEKVLQKLPPYGRQVVVAAALLGAQDNQKGKDQAFEYLLKSQLPDGAWAEDVIATSLGILAFVRHRVNLDKANKAGQWLLEKQYPNGGWPAFYQLHTWAMAWALAVMLDFNLSREERAILAKTVRWLEQGKNADGSFGSTPPFTHPDLDDTAVALIALAKAGSPDIKIVSNCIESLQNPDGSWGTFPDFGENPPGIRSQAPVYIVSADVTVHALEGLFSSVYANKEKIAQGFRWLIGQQEVNGAFPAIWYEGDIYGTAQTLELLVKWPLWERRWAMRQASQIRRKSLNFLLQAQKEDGSWGLSPVETALTESALLYNYRLVPRNVLDRGIAALLSAQKTDGSFEPVYKGIYAKGWNYEEPLSTTLTALRAFERYISLPRRR